MAFAYRRGAGGAGGGRSRVRQGWEATCWWVWSLVAEEDEEDEEDEESRRRAELLASARARGSTHIEGGREGGREGGAAV